MTDPIADLLTRIRNALMRSKETVNAPYSKLKHELAKLLVKEGFNGQYLFVIPEHDLVVVKFTKYLHNRDNGYVISLGPMDYLLWLPFSWLKAIGEAFAGDGETSTEDTSDGGINMPATMSVKDKFNCPNTTTDKCPPVQKMQDLVFGLVEAED